MKDKIITKETKQSIIQNNRSSNKATRTILERIKIFYDVLAAQNDYISITYLSQATGLSTKVIKTLLIRIVYIRNQYPILIKQMGRRTYLKLIMNSEGEEK